MAILNGDNETFVVYGAALAEPKTIEIHLFCQTEVTLLMSERNGISAEYLNFSNVFSSDFAAELLEHIKINDHSINLLDNK